MPAKGKTRFASVRQLSSAILEGVPGKVSGLLDLGFGLESVGWIEDEEPDSTTLLHLACASKNLHPLREALAGGSGPQWEKALSKGSEAMAWLSPVKSAAKFREGATPAEVALILDDGGLVAKFLWGTVFVSLMNQGQLPSEVSGPNRGTAVWRAMSGMAARGRGLACVSVWDLLAECPVDWTDGGELRPTKPNALYSSFLWTDEGAPLLRRLLSGGMDPDEPWEFSRSSIVEQRENFWTSVGTPAWEAAGSPADACRKTMALLSGSKARHSMWAPPLVLAALCGSDACVSTLLDAGASLTEKVSVGGVQASPLEMIRETWSPSLLALAEERVLSKESRASGSSVRRPL